MNDRILLLGATGRLGREIFRELTHHRKLMDDAFKFEAPTHDDLDLEQADDVVSFIRSVKPTLVINCTAMNGLEACEQDPAGAIRLNVVAPALLAQEAKRIGASMIHFSTDYAAVPTGDTENAWGMYGVSKSMGEAAVNTIHPYSVVFRLASIYSIDTFEGSLSPIKQLKDGKGTPDNPIRVLPQFTTPTSTRFIASAIMAFFPQIMREPKHCHGIYALTTTGAMWKSDFARLALKHFAPEVDPREVTIVESPLPLPRPQYSVMSLTSLVETFDYANDLLRSTEDDLGENAKVWHSRGK